MYKSEDCGIFIGLSTMPLGRGKEFYENEIQQGIFASYKRRLHRYFKKGIVSQEEQKHYEEFEQYFYRPKAYYLMGNYDLAVVSLIDEFSISSRVFHPYSCLLNEEEPHIKPHNFTYQTITGYVPELSFFSRKGAKHPSILDKAQNTFLATELGSVTKRQCFPFIGICSLKLNNALLVGGGSRLLNLTLCMLKERIEKSKAFEENNLDYILLNSFGWNEITILFFSNSFKVITDKILEIRELPFEVLSDYSQNDFFEYVQNNCLMHSICKIDNLDIKNIKKVSLMVNTLSIFGYDMELMEHPQGIEKPPAHFKPFDYKELKFYTRWYIKPGHLQESIAILPPSNQANISIGRGDYVQTLEENNFKRLVEHIQHISQDKNHPLTHHITKLYSIPELTYSRNEISITKTKEAQIDISECLGERYVFSVESINAIKNQLKQYRIAKVLRDKVVNMYISYNDGMHDPVLYGYFVDLYPYLERIRQDIALYGKDNSGHYLLVKNISTELQIFCDEFEKAHRNRFHLSHIMNEITDYNIEFSGGIQQIVSAFDGAYKSITTVLGSNVHPLPFVYITGYSGVVSTIYSAKLNSYHLFQPEFFVAVATHEAANNILDNSREDVPMVLKLQKYMQMDSPLRDKYPEAVSYFVVDILTYYLAYNKNPHLFLYWHWGNFLQTALYYNTDGNVNRHAFRQLLLRMMLLFEFLEEDVLHPHKTPCNQLQMYWMEDFERMANMTKHLLSDAYLKDWFEYAEILANKVVIDDFSGISENRMTDNNKTSRAKRKKEVLQMLHQPMFEQNQVRDEKSYLNAFKDEKDREVQVLLGRFEEMDFISGMVIEAFKKGEVYLPKSFNVIHSFSFYIQTIFYAYLKLLYEINEGEIRMIERDEMGEPIESNTVYDRLLFDSTGGMFVRNYTLRRLYFRYRSLLLQSIWGISWEFRKKLFL